MANIQSFEVNGVSYAYDTESRNPLSLNVFEKAINDGLVYDKDTKAPVEVVGISANKLKPSADGDKIRSLTFYAMGCCFAFPITITYKGSLNNTSGKPKVEGILNGHQEVSEYNSDNKYENTYFGSILWTDAGEGIDDPIPTDYYRYGYDTRTTFTDDSTDEGFELVSFDKTIKVGEVTVTITSFEFY